MNLLAQTSCWKFIEMELLIGFYLLIWSGEGENTVLLPGSEEVQATAGATAN